MHYITIDKTLKKPIYKQLEVAITDAIHHRVLKHGDQLPTEAELASFFDISVVIIRKAYDGLAEKRYIKKIQGKGTFVDLIKPIRLPLNHLQVLESEIRKNHLLEEKWMLLSRPIEQNSIFQVTMKCVVHVDHMPTYLKNVVAQSANISALKVIVPESPYTSINLFKRGNPKIHKATLKAYSPGVGLCKLLHVDERTPFYHLSERIDFETVTFWVDSYFPSDYIELEARL